ncbi:hypothetical protein LCM20_02290 [Halobacillus litoralis]|uniref:hypothetical protein n=1 Tax=Halobacillus litoralis TaxID=45668 RepID=UPI001CD67853|nr:hypothetical protein [Halobacillus litoralis]MCA0969418.1 hypothetical protein [Halobacillus litoralis]
MAFLAFLVIFSFILCAFALGQEVFWLAGALFLLGFVFMGYGLKLKRSATQSA